MQIKSPTEICEHSSNHSNSKSNGPHQDLLYINLLSKVVKNLLTESILYIILINIIYCLLRIQQI